MAWFIATIAGIWMVLSAFVLISLCIMSSRFNQLVCPPEEMALAEEPVMSLKLEKQVVDA